MRSNHRIFLAVLSAISIAVGLVGFGMELASRL
jgi:hypothetical protein